jgi:ribosome-binding factor A
MRRVNETLKKVLSEGIGELKDPRIGFVTLTGVEATEYVSVYGPEKAKQATLDALASAHGVLQAKINRELHLRRTPQLTFEYDESVERGVRMSQLIDELAPADTPDDGE